MHVTFIHHHHIYKNAGTTIDWILNRNFSGRVLHIEGENDGDRLYAQDIRGMVNSRSEPLAISSHSTPLPEQKWARIHFTLLREPVERFISIYEFDRAFEDDSPARRAAKCMDLRSYCDWWLAQEDSILRNWQTRCCTPQRPGQAASQRPGWDFDLGSAKAAVSEVALAGTVDLFDQTIVVLEAFADREGFQVDGAYLRQNTRNASSHEEGGLERLLGADRYARLVDASSLDYELLDFVRRSIAAKYNAVDPKGIRLGQLRKRCEHLKTVSPTPSVRIPGRDEWVIVSR